MKNDLNEYDIETDDSRLDDDKSVIYYFSKENILGFIYSIQCEHKLLRTKFEVSLRKDKSDIFTMLLAEICDKIYLIRTIGLLGKYDMISIFLSLYLLYHILLLTFITFFYNVKTIQRIWNEKNFTNLNYDFS